MQKAGTELAQPGLPISVLLAVSVVCVSSWEVTSKGSLDRVVAVLYTTLTALLNPLIYILRNKDVKAAGSCSRAINNWQGYSV